MRLSACMKHRRSPCATSAPAFIWLALPRFARITRAPACFASLAVLQAGSTLSRSERKGAVRYLQQSGSASSLQKRGVLINAFMTFVAAAYWQIAVFSMP